MLVFLLCVTVCACCLLMFGVGWVVAGYVQGRRQLLLLLLDQALLVAGS